MAELPKIFCWINSGRGSDWVTPVALAEDGVCLAQHVSSNDYFAKWDVGYGDGRPWDAPVTDRVIQTYGPFAGKREKFREHYPEGYELVWIDHDEVQAHEGLLAAMEKNRVLGEAAKAKEEADARA